MSNPFCTCVATTISSAVTRPCAVTVDLQHGRVREDLTSRRGDGLRETTDVGRRIELGLPLDFQRRTRIERQRRAKQQAAAQPRANRRVALRLDLRLLFLVARHGEEMPRTPCEGAVEAMPLHRLLDEVDRESA